MLCVSDRISDSVWSAIQEPTERQNVRNQVNAAMIFAGADFVKVQVCHEIVMKAGQELAF